MRGALALLFAAAVVAGCRPRDVREARDFERMRVQQRYDPYDASRFFANGATMQSPPAHTVARGPVVPGDSTVDRARGERQFAISCAPCHGAGGFGGGQMAPNLDERRPASLRSARVAALSDSQLVAVITDGFGAMPALGWQMAPATRASVVEFVRGLPLQPPTPATRRDSTIAAYLRRIDSLNASGAPIGELLRARASMR
jgi:mono/diheme cytochrome c family protein